MTRQTVSLGQQYLLQQAGSDQHLLDGVHCLLAMARSSSGNFVTMSK
jgi:hypothetical protein